MTTLKAAALFAVFSVVGALTACIHDSDADSGNNGLTEAQVKALIADAVAPLETRIAELEASQAGLTGNVLRAPSLAGSTKAGLQKAATDVSAICSTLIYTPLDFPGFMESAGCKSSTGYLLRLPVTTQAITVQPLPLDDERAFYANADCTGTPYITAVQLGEFGLQQGAVFTIYNGSGGMTTMYTPANPTITEHINAPYGWEMDNVTGAWECNPNGNPDLTAIQILPNDIAVTGIADSYTGPIIY